MKLQELSIDIQDADILISALELYSTGLDGIKTAKEEGVPDTPEDPYPSNEEINEVIFRTNRLRAAVKEVMDNFIKDLAINEN